MRDGELSTRAASISAMSAATERVRASAISFNASQKADSSEMLVAWPAIVTECLIMLAGVGDAALCDGTSCMAVQELESLVPFS